MALDIVPVVTGRDLNTFIGLPWQIVVGPRGVAEGVVELKRRATGERQSVSLEAALAVIGG